MSSLNTFNQLLNQLQQINQGQWQVLPQIYHSQAVFIDPWHRVDGIDAINNYYQNMYSNVSECQFEYIAPMAHDGHGYVQWRMQFRHPKLNRGNAITVPGCSHFVFDDKFQQHRDYFDPGAMVYEHLPLLRNVIAYIKRRASA